MTAGLEISGISKAFDGERALEDVALTVPAGSVTGLMGPNGSGKSVLVDIITGQTRPDAGRVQLLTEGDRQEIGGLPAETIAGLGVARCWADVRLLGMASVLDEVLVGAYTLRQASILGSMLGLGAARRDQRESLENCRQLLNLVGLGARTQSRPDALSRGERARVGIARALASDPGLLILDGPANGLAAEEVALLTDLILGLKAARVTVLLAERNMKMIADCCDSVVVLNAGRRIAAGSPADCFATAAVQRAYFGATAAGIAAC